MVHFKKRPFQNALRYPLLSAFENLCRLSIGCVIRSARLNMLDVKAEGITGGRVSLLLPWQLRCCANALTQVRTYHLGFYFGAV